MGSALWGSRGSHGRIALFAAISTLISLVPVFLTPLPAVATPQTDGNPNLAAGCGLDVLFVLDETGSIDDINGQEAAVEAAYSEFVASLVGTGSGVGVIEFSSTPEVSGTPDPSPGSPESARRVTPGGYLAPSDPTVADYPGGGGSTTSTSSYNPGGYTNWEDALWDSYNFGNSFGFPDLLIFFTDGDPNTVDGGSYGQYLGNENPAAAAAETWSDQIKANGTHMLGIGLGFANGSSSETRLSSVTGDEQGSSGSIDLATDDYVLLSNQNEISEALSQISNQLCTTGIIINKHVPSSPQASFDDQSGTGTGFEPDAGWQFDVDLSDNEGFDWVSAPPASTAGGGSVTFSYSLDNRGDTSDATLSETLQSGYQFLGGNCVITPLGGAAGNPIVLTQNGSVIQDIPDRASVECDVYNQGAFLELDKIVVNDDGGTADDSDWTLSATGQNNGGSDSGADGFGPTLLPADTYDLAESGLSGYTAGDWSCSSGGNGSTVTLEVGQVVTCTITNNDQAPRLTLEKIVDNSNGGDADSDDFVLTADQNGGDGLLQGTSGVSAVIPGGTYDLSESGPDFYSLIGWSCDNGDDDGSVTLSSGDDVTCTATNASEPGTLTLIKELAPNNFGATASVDDWTLGADGFGIDFSGTSGVSQEVPAGIFQLGEEDGPDGWQQVGEWDCGNAPYNADTNAVSVGIGQDVTCTVTNAAIQPELTLVKQLDISDSANETTDDFELTAEGPVTTSGVTGDASVTDAPVDVGEYSLSEDGPSGYVQVGDWVCIGGDQTGADTVELSAGDVVTCTVTNQDEAPGLTVIKEVVNDDGGDAVAGDFQLRVNGSAVDQNTEIDGIVANTEYTVTEDSADGYTQSGDVTCVDNDTQETVGHPVTLDEGQSVTCTITNDDNAPGLTVVKEVVNDDGGDAVAEDFQLYVNGEAVVQGIPLDVESNVEYSVTEDAVDGYDQIGDVVCVDNDIQETVGHPVTLDEGQSVTCTITNDDQPSGLIVVKEVVNEFGGNAVPADFQLYVNGSPVNQGEPLDVLSNQEYTVTEEPTAGYQMTGIVCEDQDGVVGHPVTLEEGQSVLCTVTNQDLAPELIVVKEVDNSDGGTAEPGDFQLYVNGELADQGVSIDGISSNTEYTVTEDQLPGYETTNVQCVDNDTLEDIGHPVTLDEAQSATCTVTNGDLIAHVDITAVCLVVDNFGVGRITVELSPGVASVEIFDEANQSVENLMASGSIEVPEGASYTWVATASDNYIVAESEGELSIDECTPDRGQIIVRKLVEEGDPTDVAFVISTTGFTLDDSTLAHGEQGSSGDLLAGAGYAVTETIPAGWIQVSATCDDGSDPSNIDLSEGETVTCTFVNGVEEEVEDIVVLPFTGIYATDLARLAGAIGLIGLLALFLARRREEEEGLDR